MAWWTEKDALNEQIRLLKKELKAKEEQICEMQLLIDKANKRLNEVNIPNVMGCLQEKKKAWEERQSKWMDEEKSLTDDTDFDDERLILIENINLSEQIINDFEEMINKNSP